MDYQSFPPSPLGSMPPKNFTPKFIGLVLAILILSGLAYAGLWFWNDKNKEMVVPTFTPRVIDETADWKTYRNNQYGFEIKYPKDWVYKISDGDEEALYIDDGSYCEGTGCSFTIKLKNTLASVSVSEINNKDKDEITSQQLIPFAGVMATRLYHKSGYGVDEYFLVIPVRNGSVVLEYVDTKTHSDILSTFKFVEPIPNQQDAVKIRDRQRYADVLSWRTAFELYLDDRGTGTYPMTLEEQKAWLKPTFNYLHLSPPMPADGSCSDAQNIYKYKRTQDGKSYSLEFCLGQRFNSKEAGFNMDIILDPGLHVLDPSGIK